MSRIDHWKRAERARKGGTCAGFAGNRGCPTDEDKLGRIFQRLAAGARAREWEEDHVFNALFVGTAASAR